jgi:methylenetetrahydrofolate reductase (NADPH)
MVGPTIQSQSATMENGHHDLKNGQNGHSDSIPISTRPRSLGQKKDSTDSSSSVESGCCKDYVTRRRAGSTVLLDAYQSLTEKIEARVESGDPFFSLEFFPPRTKAGAVNLLARLDRMRAGSPLFCDITWHPAGNPSGDSETSSLTIASAALNYSGLNTMLHMTCSEQSIADINRNLARAKEVGIRNILALRGDRRESSTSSDLSYAVELVQHIRQEYGDYFVTSEPVTS